MQTWTQIIRGTVQFPQDRPFIVYWRNNICLIQYSRDIQRFFCSAFPAHHMAMIEMHPRDMHDVTHWMELPNAPAHPPRTGDGRKGNYSKYTLKDSNEEKHVDQKKGRKTSTRRYQGLQA